eukprot:CAMPEP_0174826060 /NCGR_PEP_ID=MMETSP1107-20130205/43461_1 /TAXON_ID=36770 /ORGANISM="Paraphysomonas vestita, Strain GFlagA" /LENGTH=78 /DNA_ID=CAMNT_0016058455 /DNA_START=2646 /DNA_END=2882 /DNA_ORIENTATION=-
MEALSNKPVASPQKAQSTIFRDQINQREEESKKRDAAFNRLQDLAIQRSKYHVNQSGPMKGQPLKTDHGDDSDDGWDD